MIVVIIVKKVTIKGIKNDVTNNNEKQLNKNCLLIKTLLSLQNTAKL